MSTRSEFHETDNQTDKHGLQRLAEQYLPILPTSFCAHNVCSKHMCRHTSCTLLQKVFPSYRAILDSAVM